MVKTADELTATRTTLLQRLKNWQDQSSWQDFFDTYWKLIYSGALKAGLNEAEAQEVVQETMISVAKHMPTFEYDRAIGSFKAWLLTMTRWRITDQLRLNRTVILVVTQCGPAVARRLIDFAAGTAYALRSTVETLEKGAVYAICPHGASLSPEVRARLVASNYTTVGY